MTDVQKYPQSLLQILLENKQIRCTPNVPCFCNIITVCLTEHIFEATKTVRKLYLVLNCDLKREKEREEKGGATGKKRPVKEKNLSSSQALIPKHKLKLLNV